MAEIKLEYQSVKDCLPANDGKFYDVICILMNDNIEHSYCYRLGKYQDHCFHIDNAMYFENKDFRCSWNQKKVIAWKPLEIASHEVIHTFYEKAGAY